jgi:hypothetical protein
MSRPLEKDAANEQRRRDHGPHNFRCAPPQAQQKRAKQCVQHHPDQEDMQARYREKMHKARLCKTSPLGIGDATPIPQQQGPEHRPSPSARYVPVHLTADVRPQGDECILHPPPPIPKYGDAVGGVDVQGATDDSPG